MTTSRIPKVGDMIRCPLWKGGSDSDLDDMHKDNFYPVVKTFGGQFWLAIHYKSGRVAECQYSNIPWSNWSWEYLEDEEPSIPDYLERIGEREDDI